MKRISTKLVVSTILLIVITLVAIGIPSYIQVVEETDKVLTTQMSQRIMCAWDVADGLNNNTLQDTQAKKAYSKYIISRMVGKTGYGYTFDSKGTVIDHPEKDMIGKNLSEEKFIQEIINNKDEFKNNKYGQALTKLVTYEWEGREKFAYYTYYKEWDMFITLSGYYDEFSNVQKKSMTTLLTVGMIILLLAAIIIFFFAKKYTRPIVEVAQSMEEVQKGNLKIEHVHFKSQDELGLLTKGFNNMLDNLKNLTNSIKESAINLENSLSNVNTNMNQTISASEEVATAIEEISKANQSLAMDIEEGTGSIKQISDIVVDTNDSSKRMIELTMNTNKQVEKGSNVTRILKDKSHETKTYFNNLVDKINLLEKQSSTISEVTEVISGISEKTNLLSLNAAIESARAGEAGRGFAVVADEIRKLAQQSATETENINKVVTDIQKEIGNIVQDVADTNKLIESQTKIADTTEKAFKEIENTMNEMVKNIEIVSSKVQDIEDNTGSSLSMIENISAISEETSANSQQVTSISDSQLGNIQNIGDTVEEIKELSKKLTKLVENFRTE